MLAICDEILSRPTTANPNFARKLHPTHFAGVEGVGSNKQLLLERELRPPQSLQMLPGPNLRRLVAVSLCFEPGNVQQVRVGALRKGGGGLRQPSQAIGIAIGRGVKRCGLGNGRDYRFPIEVLAGASGKRQRRQRDLEEPARGDKVGII